MRRAVFVIVLTALVVTGLYSSALAGGNVSRVVRLALEGFGGNHAISNVSIVQATGDVVSVDSKRPGIYTHYIRAGARLRIDLAFGPDTLSRVRSGLASYVSKGPGGLRQVTAIDKWRISFEQKSLGLMYDLMRPDLELDYSGMGFSQGRRFERLTMYDPAGPALVVYFDAESGQVIKTEMDSGYEDDGMFVMEFSDYRPVGGLVLPHVFREFVAGRLVMQVSIQSVSFNAQVSPYLFRP